MLGVKPGDKLLVVAKDGKVLIMHRPKSFARAIKGIARGLYPPDHVERERKSWD
jgi:hypothetical protein